jgi:soluble lytic murein transglycosylase-like protein
MQMFNPPEKVIQWLPIVDKYCVELQVSQSLILAMIQQESGGNPDAKRYEPAYERKYILSNKVWLQRCKDGGFSTRDAATSWSLMQILLPTAWSYGIKTPADLAKPENSILVGTAIMAGRLKKYTPREAIMSYNAGEGSIKNPLSPGWRYADNVMALWERYKEYMRSGKAQASP